MQELIEPMISGKPYPIRGLVLYGTNLLHTVPNVPRTLQALERLEFVLTIDVLPQDHVAWSDIVLPEATYLERYDDLWACAHKTPYIALREPAIEPLHETKPGWWIAKELGRRLGLDAFFPWATAEEYLDARLGGLGLSVAQLHEQGGIAVQKGKPYLAEFEASGASPFATASQRIELHSAALAKAGFDPIPRYEAPAPVPAGHFRLLYGRSPVHTFARTQNTPALHDVQSENDVWVNDEAAARLGIRDGERIWLENQDGIRSGPIRVKVTARIRGDCVFTVHGFGHDAPGMTRAHRKGASDARLQTRYALDPISGGAGMRINFVRLVREA